jgi:hypothetical protein
VGSNVFQRRIGNYKLVRVALSAQHRPVARSSDIKLLLRSQI